LEDYQQKNRNAQQPVKLAAIDARQRIGSASRQISENVT
jgi:hypothetical protein